MNLDRKKNKKYLEGEGESGDIHIHTVLMRPLTLHWTSKQRSSLGI